MTERKSKEYYILYKMNEIKKMKVESRMLVSKLKVITITKFQHVNVLKTKALHY